MIFAILTLLAALAVAGVAGWFSIIGVMAIYAGAPYHAALVMGIVLELAKLVTTSWIYRNWEFANWKLKIPLIYFTAALMLATSIGVFGFLSKAHLEQGAKTIDNAPKIERIDQQISREKSIIADNEKVIAQLDATINSYLGKDRTDKSVSVRKSQAPQRTQLKDEIDSANKRIDELSEEKFKLQSEIRSLDLEVGPIRYIAELIYGVSENGTKNIESAVKIFTLLIVSTLDPLAIILLIAANHTIMRRQNEKNQLLNQDNQADNNPLPAELNHERENSISEENPAGEGETLYIHSDSTANIETPEMEYQRHTSDTTEKQTEMPLEVISEKIPNLEEFLSTTLGIPPAIIRSPNPTSVSKINSPFHFIPQRVNEEEKVSKKETRTDVTTEKDETSSSTKVSKIPDSQTQNHPTGANQNLPISTPPVSERHKYPKALSWLKEFTRTSNE